MTLSVRICYPIRMAGNLSRRKGARGELEASKVLSLLTGKTWIRTARGTTQPSGDLFPENPLTCLDWYVEVKRLKKFDLSYVKRCWRKMPNRGGVKVLMYRADRMPWFIFSNHEFCLSSMARIAAGEGILLCLYPKEDF